MLYFIVLFSVFAVVLAVCVALSFVPAFQTYNLVRVGRRINLGVPADLDPSFRRRMGSRIRASSLGGLLGILASAAVAWREPDLVRYGAHTDLGVFYGILAVAVVGASAGIAWAALRSGLRRDATRPRMARLRVTTVDDYVPPILRRLALVGVGLGIATPLVAVVLAPGWAGTPAFVGTVVLLVVAGGGVLVFSALAPRIVAKGRATTSTDEMVWDDALLSESLRDLLTAPLQALSFGMFYSLLSTPGGAADWAFVPAFAGLCLFIAVSIVLRGTRDWFLTALWRGARRRTDEEEAARLAAADPATAPWPDPEATHR